MRLFSFIFELFHIMELYFISVLSWSWNKCSYGECYLFWSQHIIETKFIRFNVSDLRSHTDSGKPFLTFVFTLMSPYFLFSSSDLGITVQQPVGFSACCHLPQNSPSFLCGSWYVLSHTAAQAMQWPFEMFAKKTWSTEILENIF